MNILDDFETQKKQADGETSSDALREELEDLRALFQRELDRAGAEGEDLTQTDDSTEEAPEKAERCVRCGKDAQDSPDDPYCAACREEMLARPARLPAVLCTVFVFLLAGASLFFCTRALPDYSMLLSADAAYQAHKLADAQAQYKDYFSNRTQKEYSLTAVKRLADCSWRCGEPKNAQTQVDLFFPEWALRLPWNARYRNMPAPFHAMENTMTKIGAVFQDISVDTDFDYEAKDAQLQALLESGDDVSPVLVEYYRYWLMRLADKPNDALLTQLIATAELDTEQDYGWAYLTTLIETAAVLRDAETAEHWFEAAKKVNAQQPGLYAAYAKVYRYRETPDADAMLKLAQEEEANADAQALPVYRLTYAVAYLLKGDTKSAITAVEDYFAVAMQTQQFTLEDCNLYALCAAAAQDSETYTQVEDFLSQYGKTPSPLVQQVRAGTLTVQAALQDNGGEIA